VVNNDKQIERKRYDKLAQVKLSIKDETFIGPYETGSSIVIPFLRAPYLKYEQLIQKFILPNCHVLEIGSGTGMHTHALVKTGAHITASDISENSLNLLKNEIGSEIQIEIADMEKLPFKSNSFDIVVSAGSLSYGNPIMVDLEIHRVLKSEGMFICVDSLNHNPLYRFNRWLHYKRGERTKSTLKNMPTIDRINSISKKFEFTEVYYYGAISWLMGVLARVIGMNNAVKLSDLVDRIIVVRRSAFKFVLVARNILKK
jgi:ubiquinone/menaquinone biosynthesis C-methylase UbiE